MGLLPEEDKFSSGKVVKLEMKNFFRSSSARLVGDDDNVKTVLRFFLECFYIHHDMAPKEMDGAVFKDVVLGVFPRRFTGKEKYLSIVPDVVNAYMQYLQKETHLQDLPQIQKTLAGFPKRFTKAVKSVKEADRIADEPPAQQIVRDDSKVGRNDPCPCGSGKKYKKCCQGK
jgi:hypothetical protein